MAVNDELNQVKVVVEKRIKTGSSYKVRRTILEPSHVELRIEGSRASDNLSIRTKSRIGLMNSEGGIHVGDTISCIIDDVDVTNLVGAWNFYYNLRDESGYNLDGFMRSGTEKYDVNRTDSSRQQGQKYFDCDSNNCSIKLVQTSEEDNLTKLNFRGGCEMHFWIKTPNSFSGKQVIFHRMDSDYGIEVGIEKLSDNKYYAFVNTRTSRDDGSSTKNKYSLYATASDGTQGDEYDGSSSEPVSNLEVELGKDYFIRIWRDPEQENYVIGSSVRSHYFRLTVNNGSDAHYHHEKSTDLAADEDRFMDHNGNTSISAYFMSNDSQNNNFSGRVYAVRFYNQALKDYDASSIYRRIMPMNTMKFGGVITKEQSNWDGTMEISAVGWSKPLLHTVIDEDMFSGSSYITDQLLETSIQNMITQYNSSKIDTTGTQTASVSNSWVEKLGKDIVYKMKFANNGYTAANYSDEDDYGTSGTYKDITNAAHKYSPRHINKLTPSGNLLTYCKVLAMLGGKENDSSSNPIHNNGADQFHVLPRKVLVFESSDIKNHCYLSTRSDGCRYNNVGTASSQLYNDVHILGKGKISTKRVGFDGSIVTQNSTYNVFTGVFSVSGTPSGAENISAGVGRRQLLDVAIYIYDSSSQFVKIGRNDSSGDYVVDWDSGLVTFKTGNPAQLWLHYRYLDYTNFGATSGATSDGNKDEAYPNYYNSRNTTSINKYGIKSLTLHFPQMEDITSTASLARRVLHDTSTEKDEVELVNTRLAFGQQVGTIMTTDSDYFDIHGKDMIIKSVRYSVGKKHEHSGVSELKSYIILGDHQYNFLDLFGNTEQKLESVRESLGIMTLVGS